MMVRLKKTFDNCTEAEADWCGKNTIVINMVGGNDYGICEGHSYETSIYFEKNQARILAYQLLESVAEADAEENDIKHKGDKKGV